MLVESVICISSIDKIGGKSIGFFAKKGKLIVAIKIILKCNDDEIIRFLNKILPFFIRFGD